MHELCLTIIAVLLAMFIYLYFTCGDKGKFVDINPNGTGLGNTSNLMCPEIYMKHNGTQQACAF